MTEELLNKIKAAIKFYSEVEQINIDDTVTVHIRYTGPAVAKEILKELEDIND